MSHPKTDNKTPFAFEPAFFADEEMRCLFVPLIKATFKIVDNRSLVLADEQSQINYSGECYGDPGFSSYKYEPEFAFTKLATDVVLIGCAHSPDPSTTTLDVGLKVGPVHKVARVFGDRFLSIYKNATSVSAPLPFERIPLTYENAFGGWDRRHLDPNKHSFDKRNPVGTGYGYPDMDSNTPLRLPNLEDPQRLWKGLGDRPAPTGFGFIAPNWHPRASFAGTYDKKWEETRKPLLPVDFDRRFFNAASAGMIAPGFLRGNEPVTIVNTSPAGRISFSLPGIVSPTCTVEIRGRKKEILQTQLDTVIINTDENIVFLLWRSHMIVRNGPHDISSILIDTESKIAATAVA